MKFIRILVFSLFVAPFAATAATSDFMMAAQLLAAAKAADIQQVQALVNNGADINFVDSTGVSIVCTALMNNDVRAAQILQMYGADASKCDRQIKQYNNRNKPRGSGGLFSGLSSAQSISLAAAGAAVVVGGLLLLTDVFDPGNDNDSASSGGNRPDNNPDEEITPAVPYLAIPYSPAYLGLDGKITTSDETYRTNLTLWDPTAGSPLRQADFNYFRPQVQAENNYVIDGIYLPMQNYLLTMHGYSAFANEYMGQGIFRDTTTRNPILVGNSAGGGRPVIVGLVTDNGVSATGSLNRAGGINYATSAAADAVTGILDKFANYNNPTTDGLGTEIVGFDLSGAGTALNPFANSTDNALGKIVAGWQAGGRTYGDLIGFVPNGRLGIFVTGGGKYWQDITDPTSGTTVGTVVNGDGADDTKIDAGDVITLDGKKYQILLAVADSTVLNPTITVNGTTYKLPNNSTMLKGVCSSDVDGGCDDVSDIAIYVGTDGGYYVNTSGGNGVDSVLMVDGGNLYTKKELVDADYKNFEALFNARTVSDVLANVSVIDASRSADYKTVQDMPALFSLLPSASKEAVYASLINGAYDKNNSDITTQGEYAHRMFNNYTTGAPIFIMPAGEFQYTGGAAEYATFENYAPLMYDGNLEHMFMTVVAVQHKEGTYGATSIANYGNGTGSSFGPLQLAYWTDTNGTLEDESDDVVYMSRKCGVAGLGLNGIDPWCFSAAGPTAQMATAAAAGAVASLKAAFDYMSNPQIFMLMALTADGYLLGTDSLGTPFTPETLAGYLQNMYELPPEYNADTLLPDAYLRAFADVFGYGMINLERAMTPNKKIYFFDGTNIVSASGNAYWRAAQNTTFRPSSVMNLRGATIRAPFFDVLESVDGAISLPRVWENEFALGAADERGLYMGDVLGGLKTRRDSSQRSQIGALGVEMSFSERAYDDNLGGLDNLALDYQFGNWNFGASYQHYLTDGMSRFDGAANPILGLVSNAVVSDVKYKSGNWSFAGRAFSGAITDEGLLENDPTIAAQYMPAKLGLMNGGLMGVGFEKNAIAFETNVGFANETNTLLGAYSDGLLNLGNGNTAFVDAVAKYQVDENVGIMARATFAQTQSDVSGDFVLGMSNIYSNAFSLSANVGNFEFTVAQPLAITSGSLQYAFADYEVVQTDDNNYRLDVVDTYVADLNLRPEKRELRFSGTYRHNFGEFTDGAIGFIYRVNPNHTYDFGNESILMMKLTHRLGI